MDNLSFLTTNYTLLKILSFPMDKENRTAFVRKQMTSAEVKKSPLSELRPNDLQDAKRMFDRKTLNNDK